MTATKLFGDNKTALISLFCGAGGLDLGFSQEGFESILAFDNDAAAIETFNANFPSGAGVRMDLSLLRSTKFLELVSETVLRTGQKPRGLVGGPPCQGVSNSNADADPNDPRNSLMTTYLRLLNALEDTYEIEFFVFENVPGLLNEKNKARFTRLKRELSKRFHVTVQKVDAANFGVPQHRERVLICGLNRKRYDEPMPLLEIHNQQKTTVRDTIESLVEPVFFKRGIDSSTFPLHPNHWTMNPKSAKFKQQTTTAGRSFRRLNWDLPSRTVAYGHREIHVHPQGHRRLSEQTRLRQIIAEIFVIKGLDAALNIDRESFNYAHPHYIYLQRWVHEALRQLTNVHKKLAGDTRRESIQQKVAISLGQRFNKAEHRRHLKLKLQNRSEGSIEFKHCNISAAMIDLGFPYLRGYQPRSNYQTLLGEILVEQARGKLILDQAALTTVQTPAISPTIADFAKVKSDAPRRSQEARDTSPTLLFRAVKRDYLEREARNQSLGLAGEEFVIPCKRRPV